MITIIKTIKSELKNLYNDNEINVLINDIVEFVSGLTKTQRLINTEYKFTEEQVNEVQQILERLKKNEPIQYVLGKTFFYDLEFDVTPDVLIPRPETEELVDWIIKEHMHREPRIIDVGTGSGCIAISLAKNIQKGRVEAVDISEAAIKVASRNALKNKVENIQFRQVDILGYVPPSFDGKYDIIVSNPPYVTEGEKELMEANVLEYEPENAIFVNNPDALLFYKAIAEFGKSYLKPNGRLYFEINEKFGQEISEHLSSLGYKSIVLKKDINEKDRMIMAHL